MRPRTRLEIRSCGKSQRLPPILRRWSHKLFLVNQSIVLLSSNSAQVTRGTRKKFDVVAHRLATELLIVEIEKHPILYDKDRRGFKDAEKNCVETYCHFT